jgi:hypothetical protein
VQIEVGDELESPLQVGYSEVEPRVALWGTQWTPERLATVTPVVIGYEVSFSVVRVED